MELLTVNMPPCFATLRNPSRRSSLECEPMTPWSAPTCRRLDLSAPWPVIPVYDSACRTAAATRRACNPRPKVVS